MTYCYSDLGPAESKLHKATIKCWAWPGWGMTRQGGACHQTPGEPHDPKHLTLEHHGHGHGLNTGLSVKHPTWWQLAQLVPYHRAVGPSLNIKCSLSMLSQSESNQDFLRLKNKSDSGVILEIILSKKMFARSYYEQTIQTIWFSFVWMIS